jgi:hypothetical protein
MIRAAASVLTVFSRSAGGASSFWIFSVYCLTRVSSAKMEWFFVSTPLRRNVAGQV